MKYAISHIIAWMAFTSNIDGMQSRGIHSDNWDASEYPSGIYFYQLQTEKFTKIKKMISII